MCTFLHVSDVATELVPVAGQSNYERLVAESAIQPSTSEPRRLEAPVQASGGVSDLVAEQRR
jgi:hypothetical protein